MRYSKKTILQSEAFVRKGIVGAIKANLPEMTENRHVRRLKKKLAMKKGKA